MTKIEKSLHSAVKLYLREHVKHIGFYSGSCVDGSTIDIVKNNEIMADIFFDFGDDSVELSCRVNCYFEQRFKINDPDFLIILAQAVRDNT